MSNTNNNTRKKRVFATKQSVEVKFSDRGFAYAKMGNSDYVGIIPFYTDSSRPDLSQVPQGVPIYNITTGALEISDPENNIWIPISGGTISGGSINISGSVISGTAELLDTVWYDGITYVPNSSLKSDGIDVYIKNNLTVSGATILSSGVKPTNSSASGTVGEVRWENNFFYLCTPNGWRRVNLQYF